ncbi:MAG: amidohydrolase [Clostridia bacterium]|nr:amidohydrolase [Clostridia bacterium]
MDFLSLAQAEKAYTAEMYRLFHRIPEKSRHETETNRQIRLALQKEGIGYLAPKDNITIAVIRGARPGKVCAIRSDTDALQLTEDTGLSYASQNSGMMHACGHDSHIAIGLTCAKILNRIKDELPGTVKIIFQPAEEGEFGAQAVMETGLVNDVNAFFAVHVWSPFKTGEMRVSSKGVAASTDMFTITLKGRGGHGAVPDACIDTVVAASQLVINLQSIVSRFTSPFSPVVVTIGSLHAGTRCNIIAGEAVLEGTIRTFDPDVYKAVHEDFDRIVMNTAGMYKCGYEIDMRPACGVTYNDEALVKTALENAGKIAPPDSVGPDEMSTLGDDFGEYRSIAPVCYMKVGIRNEEIDAVYAHHHPKFKVDENALPRAVAWLVMNAHSFLDQ